MGALGGSERAWVATVMLVVLVASLCLPAAEAHVHALFSDTSAPLRFRNALGEGDSRLSFDPCGGVSDYGTNGVTGIFAGLLITAVIRYEYSGPDVPHDVNANNTFRAYYKCGEPTEADMRLADDRTVISTRDVAAPDGARAEGYVIQFRIPDEGTGCTIAVMDQNEWGVCFDVDIITSPGEVDLPYFRLGMDKTPFIIVICSIAVVIVCAVAGCYFGMSRLSISEAEQRVVKAEEKVQELEEKDLEKAEQVITATISIDDDMSMLETAVLSGGPAYTQTTTGDSFTSGSASVSATVSATGSGYGSPVSSVFSGLNSHAS